MPRPWTKEYLPNYTGFVPNKIECFGKTQGAICKDLVAAAGSLDRLKMGMTVNRYSSINSDQKGANVPKTIYGNHSRLESTWIGGPMYDHVNHHVPGYKGHFHGEVNAGTINKSYAKVTAYMLNKRSHALGKSEANPTFNSSYQKEFQPNNFRRFGKSCLSNSRSRQTRNLAH
jgi:hypothetical protein